MSSICCADIYDAYGDDVAVVLPGFNSYGGNKEFYGPVRTIKCHEDNSLVRSTLETPGNGAVLVVDGGGSMRCALLGDNLAQLGVDNGWAGIIVYGCIRDSKMMADMPIGVQALNTNPRKSVKKDVGELDVPVHFADVDFTTTHWVYADGDGIIVADKELQL